MLLADVALLLLPGLLHVLLLDCDVGIGSCLTLTSSCLTTGAATTGGDRLTAVTRSCSTGGGQGGGVTSTPGSLFITIGRLEISTGRSIGLEVTGTEDIKRGGVSDGWREGTKPIEKALAGLLGAFT